MKRASGAILVLFTGLLAAFTATLGSPAIAISSENETAGCSPVDFRLALGPVRFQDDKAWCFAFTTADLLSYRFREQLKSRRVSAVYTALTYTRYSINPLSDAGGLARFAISRAYDSGFCPDTLEEEALRRGPLGSLSAKLENLRMLKKLYDGNDPTAFSRKLDELSKSNSIVASVPREDLMRTLKDSSQRNFPIHFADLLCGNSRYKPAGKIDSESVVRMLSGKRRMLAAVDEQLTAENIVAISYYSTFLLLGDGAPRGNRHMSSLVGRRWNDKHSRCEYLIRNSFGPECLGYAGDYRAPENCQAGHIWVPRKALERNLYAVTFIKP